MVFKKSVLVFKKSVLGRGVQLEVAAAQGFANFFRARHIHIIDLDSSIDTPKTAKNG